MIVLTVVSCNGAPADGPSARFGEQGGSIGRAEGNLLVLPDPERAISRQHARIVCRAGRYAVVDNGSNPIAVNHQPRPLGQETPLWPGDLVQIGGYALQVSQGSADAAAPGWNMGWAMDATDADAAGTQADGPPPIQAPDPLLDALLQGLAAPGLRIDALTPDHMRLLGQLLREATRGAVDLLADRAATRRHMRAASTVIQARDNNPLKFAPTTDAALQHLLGSAVAGFLPPVAAMRDAFDDLRAHQEGLAAGQKAAMAGVLQRFDPQQLEARLVGRGGLAGLIPATRKARLWDLFQQLYGALSDEAQQDGDQLFDEAFLRAYQAGLDRLHADGHDWR